jgi:hypothetical protein
MKVSRRPDSNVVAQANEEYEWDLFISYASEDRDIVVTPLVKVFTQFGLKTWWDQFELNVGDSLSRKIDQGLARSRFGVVIISKAFLAKSWPEYELRGLTARELAVGSKVVLPAWFGVTSSDILKFSPPLADKKAVTIPLPPTEDDLIDTCLDILKVVKPSLLTRLMRRVAFEAAGLRSPRISVPTADLRSTDLKLLFGPRRHKELPESLLCRIRLVRAALLSVYPQSMEFWVDGFAGDAHPTTEVEIWERIALSYLEISQYLDLAPDEYTAIYTFFLAMSVGTEGELELPAAIEEHRDLLTATFQSKFPVLEIEGAEKFPTSDLDEDSDSHDYHVEDFNDPFPRELARRLAERTIRDNSA